MEARQLGSGVMIRYLTADISMASKLTHQRVRRLVRHWCAAELRALRWTISQSGNVLWWCHRWCGEACLVADPCCPSNTRSGWRNPACHCIIHSLHGSGVIGYSVHQFISHCKRTDWFDARVVQECERNRRSSRGRVQMMGIRACTLKTVLLSEIDIRGRRLVTITILFIANDRLYREPEVACTGTNDLSGNFSGSSWQCCDHIRTLASWTENHHIVQRF
jgi:hypothetical protein